MTSVLFLLYTIPITWGVAILLWVRYFQRHKLHWLSWVSLLLVPFPALFYFLCAYVDKIDKYKARDTDIGKLTFKLRIGICACCWIGELVICFTLKYMGFPDYLEIAVGGMNVFQSLLILVCWDMIEDKNFTALGDIDALAALKEQMEAGKK
ncbi:hypothetical protein M1B78_03340 [Bacteroides sp. KH569_7]|uniref:Uncharacterized protein n=1 Tax=Bacteroides muris (ex Fokt et al. 2023) TaxID=2937417 RepID=A0A9X2NZ41_9BACE|nr:hypothetical protein [Bacteroides muris (ex Fokt et al. 2023)]MCR6507232.1 hypothetical protein [Bacteroides muris (ex Fokt et al. 2023)]